MGPTCYYGHKYITHGNEVSKNHWQKIRQGRLVKGQLGIE